MDEANAALARAGFDLVTARARRSLLPGPGLPRHRRWFDHFNWPRNGRYRRCPCGWRHKHVLTVTRIIGNKPGTGVRPARLSRIDTSNAPFRTMVAENIFGEIGRELQAFVLQKPRLAPAAAHGAHSHHLCPMLPTPAKSNAGRRRAARRPQMGRVMGEVWPRHSACRGSWAVGPIGDRLRRQHQTSSSGSPPPARAPIRAVFACDQRWRVHSARRQFARWAEDGWFATTCRRRAVRRCRRPLSGSRPKRRS